MFRVVRLIVALRDADIRHTCRQGRGDGAEPAMGDDSGHVRHEQIMRDESTYRHIRWRVNGAGLHYTTEG